MNQETETRFLLQCMGLIHDKQEISFDSLTEQDWIAINKKIYLHKIAPLVYYNLSQNNKLSNIPVSIARDLRLDYFQCSLNNTRTYHELSKILKSADSNGIPIIVLKGAALAGLVYTSHALRPMNDMDLLIKPEDIRKANDMLIQLGWKCKIQNELLEILNQQGEDLEYVKNSMIDLHTTIRELPSVDPWANSKAVNIASLNMQILGYEDFLMHISLHIYKHIQTAILLGGFGMTELTKFCDIILLIRKFQNEINWDYIVRISKLNQSASALYTILNIVNRDLGENIPDDVLSELKGDAIDLPINSVLYSNRKMSKTICFLLSDKLTKHFAMMLALHNANPDKYTIGWFIGYIFRSIFPNKEYMVKRYKIKKPSLYGFYYLIRIVTAIWKFLKAIPLYISNYKTKMKKNIG
ncbi:MAG: nucleotidyltransferase family protein [Candidatus Poribacteria bacterium]